MASQKRKKWNASQKERRFTVRGIRRDPPDVQKLSKALIALVLAEAERQAQAEQEAQRLATPEGTSGEQQTGGKQHD